jgi:tripeptide aminopeptidase
MSTVRSRISRSHFAVMGLLALLLLVLMGCEADRVEEAASEPAQDVSVDPAYEEEIAAIAARSDVARALHELDLVQEQSIEDLIWLTEIPAPPFMEEERAEAFAGMLRDAGADSVWIDEEGNVLALRRGTDGDRTVALDGHLDTVFPPEVEIRVEQRGDTLFAPGISDDTRGLIAVRNVLHAMVVADIRTPDDILFIGTVGEEGLGDLRGVKHLFSEAGPGIDSWIAVDGGDESRVKVQAVGSHRYRVTYQGPGGHSWGAFGMVNPHHALGEAIAAWMPEADRFTAEATIRTSYNVGRIGGGTSVNSIPYESWMEVDMRSLDQTYLQGLDDLFQAAIQEGLEAQNQMRRHGAALEVDVDMVGDRPAGIVDTDTPLIQRAMAATRFLGVEPSLGSGSTNSNIPMSLGVPSTTIGRGGEGGGAHSLDEWWRPVRPELGDKKALLLLLAEAGLRGS